MVVEGLAIRGIALCARARCALPRGAGFRASAPRKFLRLMDQSGSSIDDHRRSGTIEENDGKRECSWSA